jgi:hypothetical protein
MVENVPGSGGWLAAEVIDEVVPEPGLTGWDIYKFKTKKGVGVVRKAGAAPEAGGGLVLLC